ncbi:MAG: hypothetical protein ACK5NT_10285 [Pyrinomonadaceae bacterium]
MKTKNSNKFLAVIFSAFTIVTFTSFAYGQSSDPDSPTRVSEGTITGSVSTSASDQKTYYYTFNVKPGNLILTTDMYPVKGTGGGVLQWTYLNSKFKKLRYDVYAAQGSPERKVDDAKVTIKRRIILKLVVEGSFKFKLKFSGSAFVQ